MPWGGPVSWGSDRRTRAALDDLDQPKQYVAQERR
jgi:hypothetical protein